MDHCCYVKKYTNSYVILVVYVDDMLIAGSSMAEINKLKQQLAENFEMKDLGPAKCSDAASAPDRATLH